MSTERFLVTGALGCIGAWVVRNLAREGAEPVVFDLASDPRRLKLIMTPDELAKVTKFPRDQISINLTGPSVGPHTGPGVYGAVILPKA